MNGKPFDIIVVGQGAAGLAAALSAVEEARARDLPVAVYADRQGLRGRGRRQHPLDARLHAHGGTRPGRAELRARHAGGDAVPGRRDLLRAACPRGAGDGAWIAGARRRVPPADLLSRQGPAAHPAGRRRRVDLPRAHARRAGRGRYVPPRLRVRRGSSARVARSAACALPAASWLPPMRWCSPAAVSRATAT